MHKYLLLILILLGNINCQARSIAIEDSFSKRELSLIYKAIDQWIDATDSDDAWLFTREGYNREGEFNYNDWIGGPEFPVLYKIYSTDNGYDFLKKSMDSHFAGAAWPGRRMALVIDKLDTEELFYAVIMHELGHFYGLHHEADGLMYERSSMSCIDQVTLAQFCAMHSCGINRHVTCKSGDI